MQRRERIDGAEEGGRGCREGLCGNLLLSATRPSKLIDGCQGHPPFLPAAWDRPAAMEPGSETV